jgi:hypothetical protein
VRKSAVVLLWGDIVVVVVLQEDGDSSLERRLLPGTCSQVVATTAVKNKQSHCLLTCCVMGLFSGNLISRKATKRRKFEKVYGSNLVEGVEASSREGVVSQYQGSDQF